MLLVLSAALAAAATHTPPAVTLEQIVAVRTPGQFTLSPDGRFVAHALEGHYLGFTVLPRFGDGNNVHVIALDTGESVQVTSGPRPKAHPRFSPDGLRLSFESEGDIWVTDLADGATRRVTTHGARDREADWSADGRELAFVSDRSGETDLWVASVDGERHGLRRLTRGHGAEQGPRWSPDGETIAFTASLRDQHYYARGVFVVPAAGGRIRRVTPLDTADNRAPRWSPDSRRLAFLSDRGGFTRVWTMELAEGADGREHDTGRLDCVSPYFTIQPAWSRDGARLLVACNRAGSYDALEIELSSARSSRLLGGGGRYDPLGWSAAGDLVYSHESSSSPPALYVRPPEGRARRLTHATHSAFRPEHFADVRRVSFSSSDGVPLHGFVLSPPEIERTVLPGVVVLHANSYGQFHDRWSPFVHALARSGFVVLLMDQRGSSGYGRDYRELAIGAWGTGTRRDVEAGAEFLKSQPGVDADRVGVMGLSFGAYNVLMALTRTPRLFQVGIAIAGVSDRRPPFANRNGEFHIGATYESNPTLFEEVSPIASVASIEAPLLVLHGDVDRNVPVQHTYNLEDELKRRSKLHQVVIYEGEAHGFAEPRNRLDSYRRIQAFLKQHLGRGASSSGLDPAQPEEMVAN